MNTMLQTSSRTLEALKTTVRERLFPPHFELVPQLNEVYELELAYYESQLLSDAEIVRNGAYFARVGETYTRHFLMCSGKPIHLPDHSSSRLRSFFETNQFKTGYATHGLFPYRGKFHPQMTKALMNVMGLKPGETVLDPMMGSGTVLIEAKLMGVNSIGLDASLFCRFMTQVKLDAMAIPPHLLHLALDDAEVIFRHFETLRRTTRGLSQERMFEATPGDLFEAVAEQNTHRSTRVEGLPERYLEAGIRSFLLLAYLDSVGYRERSATRPHFDQFKAILERYVFVAEKIQRVLVGAEAELADAQALVGDARSLPLADGSVDGILFSPPYSFAVDYLANDAPHLEFFNVSVDKLRQQMIGLRGETLEQKFALYKSDMSRVLSECFRVLRRGRICTIVVGTNNNQLSKILRVPAKEVKGIDELVGDIAGGFGFRLLRKISRQITGIANTMRTEFILMLERT